MWLYETAKNLSEYADAAILRASIFEGGQPDLSRGEENIDTGVPTEEPVSMHPQLNETVMEVVITAL